MLLDNKKTFYERFAVKMLKKLSTVIVADKNRAFFLHRQIKLDIFPHVVRNVPFLRNEIKCNVSNKNKKFSTVYIGSISDNQAIDKIIMSMVYWPSDIFFHIYGIAKHEIVEKLISLARSLGVDSQIKFEGWVAYPSIINKINKHSLGFSFYLPTQKNHIYSAGASNKRYQYMQAGIPQVSDNSMGTFELIQGNNIGLSVSPESPIDIANAVNFFYKNPNICVEYGARSRKLVEEKYNYDLEFKPIVNIIESKSNVAC
jgi:glycosyltransferase involved in cell wall biosynthesis